MKTDETAAEGTERETAEDRAASAGRRRVLGLAVSLTVLATPVAFWLSTQRRDAPAWLILAVLVLFLAGELFTVDIEFRRESHTFSFSSVPLVVGIFT